MFTGVLSSLDMTRECLARIPLLLVSSSSNSGVGGGVVSQGYFQSHFGIADANGHVDKKKSNDINSNVVSVLQAGAFFGALGSAPLSGTHSVCASVIGFARGGCHQPPS